MKKITELTPAQEARFGEWAQKWIDIGLSTESADFDAATEAALSAYKLCNLERPMVVLRMGSPYAATVGGAMAWLMLRSLKAPQVGAQVRDQVRAQVGDQVRAQVRAQVRDQVGAQVWAQVGAQVWAQVGDQVGDQVWDVATNGLSNEGASNIGWAGFVAWVSFFRDVCGWENEILEKFKIAETLVRSCGWTWWHQNVFAISDRPRDIHRDEQGRLHNLTGPAIRYPDGWSVYAVRGTRIPDEWITERRITASEALSWPNVEQRRAACEILGWNSILSELSARVIDEDGDPEIGTLVECDIPDSGAERFLRVQCGTGRSFVLPVPREVKTAVEANAWTYGLSSDELKIEIRT